ncbi:MAG: hypothetical protein HY791_26280 [Deltaproteobacteria bacterium]|nr:hypothetical protein [Deltaproteobacteria bacterium]
MALRPWFAPGVLLACSACLEECAPGTVAENAGRLTIRNFGTLASIVTADSACGFESESVRASAEVVGEPGAEGLVRWTIEGCALSFREAAFVSTDCSGAETKVTGWAKVSGTRTVSGRLTGDPNRPVIPAGPDSVRVELVIEADGFRVAANGTSLNWVSGRISGVVLPRLAVGDSGACSVPTPIAAFEAVKYAGAKLHVIGDGHDFDVDVTDSSLSATVGPHPAGENRLTGSMTVWGDVESFAVPLDPEYETDQFRASFSCRDGLSDRVRFECEDGVGPSLAEGAARLTVRSFGQLSDWADKDERCGFSSPAALASAELEGEIGGFGLARFRIEGCALERSEPHVHTDCRGAETRVSGRVVVSGTKVLFGRLTGDPTTPVVPTSDTPAEVELTAAEIRDFEVSEGDTRLVITAGTLSGRVTPRVAKDAARHGACGFETPIARFDELRYGSGARVLVASPRGSFVATIDGSDLYAVNGELAGETNVLSGTLTLDGVTRRVPIDPAEGLDPEFDPTRFAASWQCGTVSLPVSHECAFVEPIAEGAAQLSVLTMAALAEALEGDARCGFASSRSVLTVSGEVGRRGATATWTVDACELVFEEPIVVSRDCLGRGTLIRGSIKLSGTKTLRGISTGDAARPIVPTSRDPVEISMSGDAHDLAVWEEAADPDVLTIHEGKVSGVVRPRLGLDRMTGACSIPTPVAEIWVRHEGSRVTIESERKRFDATLGSGDVHAVNGDRDGISNFVEGHLELDGDDFELSRRPLDPRYDATSFLSSFSCAPGFELPVTEDECDMYQTLAEGIARLLVKAAGAMASRVNGDEECGFEALRVKARPDRVEGDPGQIGLMEWTVNDCRISASSAEASADCLGRRSFLLGVMDVDARRLVRGLRERILFVVDSIVPVTRDAVDIELGAVGVAGLEVYDLDPNQQEPRRKLRIESGHLAARVRPILGERADELGIFDIPTPVAVIDGLRLTAAEVVLVSEGKTFKLRVDDAEVSAINGPSGGRGNEIRGRVRVDGVEVEISRTALDPEFDPAEFDLRYACTPNLRATLPH